MSSWHPSPSPGSRPPLSKGVVILSAVGVALLIIAYRNGDLTSRGIYGFIALVPSIVLHELIHGVVALKFCEETAKRAGRLTLNPMRHVDVWGTIIIPAVLILTTPLAFGYAKPVPVNTSRMTRNQAMFTALAGPLLNMAIALVVAIA